jgi:hypothetical protein
MLLQIYITPFGNLLLAWIAYLWSRLSSFLADKKYYVFSSWEKSQPNPLYGSCGIFCLTVPCFDYYVRQFMWHLSMAKRHSCITSSQSTVQILMLWTMMGGALCTGIHDCWLILYFPIACFPWFRYQCHLENALYSLIWFPIVCSNCVSNCRHGKRFIQKLSLHSCACIWYGTVHSVVWLKDWNHSPEESVNLLSTWLIHWIFLSTFPCLA